MIVDSIVRGPTSDRDGEAILRHCLELNLFERPFPGPLLSACALGKVLVAKLLHENGFYRDALTFDGILEYLDPQTAETFFRNLVAIVDPPTEHFVRCRQFADSHQRRRTTYHPAFVTHLDRILAERGVEPSEFRLH